MKKIFVVGIIFLFIGIAVAPSINSTVVKTSDDLIEVTSQACGIQGFGNTTVKLTKEQYQNLEQYLVDFRARLNQTTTKEEAIPIFKDAVVELHKYGLLPHGMSVRQAQRFIIANDPLTGTVHRALSPLNTSRYTNLCCLIAGKTTYCSAANLFITGVTSYISNLLSNGGSGWLVWVWIHLYLLLAIRNLLCPLYLLSLLSFGGITLFGSVFPSIGWIFTTGLQGIKNSTGSFYGNIQYPVKEILGILYTGVLGFTGFKIFCPDNTWLFVGTALWVNMSDSPPTA
jgi:hypothetical protein